MQIAEIVTELKTKKAEVERVLIALAAVGEKPKRTMSPEARKRISEGMKRAHRTRQGKVA